MKCDCKRCGYTWSTKRRRTGSRWASRRVQVKARDDKPKKCARCRSPLWNTPRKRSGYGSHFGAQDQILDSWGRARGGRKM